MSDLVKIGKRGVDKSDSESGWSRRDFLKTLGVGSGAALVGCESRAEKIYSFVKGQEDQIPGVATWYNSTCTECSAGCGIKVRVREGRAVKIEGNTEHPVNRGSLCALGQSALQDHYDPDRVRQPLSRGGDGKWQTLAWEEAYGKVSDAVKAKPAKGKKRYFFTRALNGSLERLVSEWCSNFGFEHVPFEPSEQMAIAEANELVFGSYVVPNYKFDKADVVLSLGADFLESWVSPCEFAKGWAKARKSKHGLKLIQVEPRLSLTGSNADQWLACKPGKEAAVALAVLRLLIQNGAGAKLDDNALSRLKRFTADIDVFKTAESAGIPAEKLILVAELLKQAKHPLVVAGGMASTSSNVVQLQLVVSLISIVLGSIGDTISLSEAVEVKTRLSKLRSAIDSMKAEKVEAAFVYETNPSFDLPASFGFAYALKFVPTVVSFSSHLDETSEGAGYVLPSNTTLESWGDNIPRAGVHSLIQPVMQPVFDTRSFGDSLLEIAKKLGVLGKFVSGDAATFVEYLKASWSAVHGKSNPSASFESFWNQALENGGIFRDGVTASKQSDRADVVKAITYLAKGLEAQFDGKGAGKDVLKLVPFSSVKSFDGRAANRPWLQELPDPVTQIVWDCWAEIHTDRAKELGVKRGDFVKIRNYYGELHLPVYVTDYISRDVVAVPVGQGHTNYGRYAQAVQGNVLDLLSAKEDLQSGALVFVNSEVLVEKSSRRGNLVVVQGSDSQLGRDLAKTSLVSLAAANGHEDAHAKNGNGEHAEGEGHGEHHEPKQMYTQREHPVYRWGMAVDLSACTGCSACVVACYAENNIPVVGKEVCDQGREMSWLRIERYHDGTAEELQVSFLPMMCQHCNSAPCEPVCPVYATYHNEEGLNVMVYNRCVGTRYCSNNCSYKVRRYNWFEYKLPEPLTWQLNPDVVKRTAGVMEKCTFCVQRIAEAKDMAKDEGRMVRDGEVTPACVQTCPTEALVFGNLNDPNSKVSKVSKEQGAYKVLDHHINTQPAVTYLERKRYKI